MALLNGSGVTTPVTLMALISVSLYSDVVIHLFCIMSLQDTKETFWLFISHYPLGSLCLPPSFIPPPHPPDSSESWFIWETNKSFTRASSRLTCEKQARAAAIASGARLPIGLNCCVSRVTHRLSLSLCQALCHVWLPDLEDLRKLFSAIN